MGNSYRYPFSSEPHPILPELFEHTHFVELHGAAPQKWPLLQEREAHLKHVAYTSFKQRTIRALLLPIVCMLRVYLPIEDIVAALDAILLEEVESVLDVSGLGPVWLPVDPAEHLQPLRARHL